MPFVFHGPDLIILCILGVMLAVTIFWVWMLIDCAINQKLSTTQKIIWILVMFFTHWIGALLYLFLGRSLKQPQIVYQPHSYMQQPPQAPPAPYYPYQQGYQPVPPAPPPYQPGAMPPPAPYEHPPSLDYEQPQAMYPHDTEQ